MTADNPHNKHTDQWKRRRIRNLLGFDSPDTYKEAAFRSKELDTLLGIVENAVGAGDTQ